MPEPQVTHTVAPAGKDIDVAAANDALDAAGGFPDIVPSTGPDPFASNTPTEAATPVQEEVTPEVPATTPEAPAAEETVEEALAQFTNIPDDALTPEQKQMKQSLQADYTRKTQEIAPWRKLATELGIEDPEDFRNAAEVYQRIQDPRNWPTIHAELAEYMTEYGMSPQEAKRAASEQLEQFAPDTDPTDWVEDDGATPDSPAFQQLQAQVNQLTQQIQQGEQQRAQQAQVQALAETLTKAEMKIRHDNPSYGDDEVEAIYNLMKADERPEQALYSAQMRFESLIGGRVAKYIAGKQGALQGAPTPVAGGGVIVSEETDLSNDPEANHRAALAHVAALDREEATS